MSHILFEVAVEIVPASLVSGFGSGFTRVQEFLSGSRVFGYPISPYFKYKYLNFHLDFER